MDTRDEKAVDSPMATDAGDVTVIMDTGGHAARAPHALGLAKAEIAR